MAFWNRVTSLIAGGAVATAASDGIRPVLEPVRQHAWSKNKLRVLDMDTTARLVSQAIVSMPEAEGEAARNGYSLNRLQALVHLTQTMPGQADLDRMLNRHSISRDLFNEALAKHQVDPRFWEALFDLTNARLDPVQLANAIHRGLVADPGLLAVPPPSGTGNVPAYPTYDIPPLAEAEASGLDRDRLGVLVGLTGLPMGPHEAAQAVFRHILTDVDFQRAVAESNTRNEWGEAIKEQSRQIPTARDFLENALRGYRTLAAAIKGAALHGMSEEHATMIYQNQGRPMTVRLITQALARGGKFKPEPGEITDPYMAAIVEGNLKPAYYDLALANRYTLPSVFAIRALTQAGTWRAEKAEQRLLMAGWIPEDAKEVAAAWAGGAGATGHEQTKTELLAEYAGGYMSEDELRGVLTTLGYTGAALDREVHLADARRNASQRERVVKVIGDAYRQHAIDETTATTELAEVNVLGDAAARLLALWEKERRFTRKELTDRQVATAFKKGRLSRDAALAELEERGFSADDAATELAI